MKNVVSLIPASVLVFAGEAVRHFVGLPVNMEKLAAGADLIFKATTVSSAVMQDEECKPVPDLW